MVLYELCIFKFFFFIINGLEKVPGVGIILNIDFKKKKRLKMNIYR